MAYLPTFNIKINHSCRRIYHTWILWGIGVTTNGWQRFLLFSNQLTRTYSVLWRPPLFLLPYIPVFFRWQVTPSFWEKKTSNVWRHFPSIGLDNTKSKVNKWSALLALECLEWCFGGWLAIVRHGRGRNHGATRQPGDVSEGTIAFSMFVSSFSLGKVFRAKAMLTGKVEKKACLEVGKNHTAWTVARRFEIILEFLNACGLHFESASYPNCTF